MMGSDIKFLHAFNTIPGIGPATLRGLRIHFGSYEAAWHAGSEELKAAIPESRVERIITWKKPSLNPDKEMEVLIRAQISLLSDEDPRYPAILKEIPQSPVILYMQGALPSESCLAVVGTRRPTSYGREAAGRFTRACIEAGMAIVSGLALGIDTDAHLATLDIKGKTVAVLGSGIDRESIFPPENRMLARKIIDAGGAVISEYAPKTPAVKEHFPQRNRIISGLSRGVLVIEARERSGALITAHYALEQNRDVFAIPGSIFSPTSQGPHRLIQEGAKLVTRPDDLLEELGIAYTQKEHSPNSVLNETEEIIASLLEEPLSADEIKAKSGFEIMAVNSALSRLELKGIIKNLGLDTYQKI